MTDRKDHVSIHPVDAQTRYTELHDAFVDDVVNKGLSDSKAVHYEVDARGAYLYISDEKARVQDARGDNRAAGQGAPPPPAQQREAALRALRRALRNEFPGMPVPHGAQFSEIDFQELNGHIRDYYAAGANDPNASPQQQRLNRITAEIYGHHATKKGSLAKLNNPRGRAAGLLRLEDAVARAFLADPDKMGRRRGGDDAAFAARYAEKFVKNALGKTRLDGLTPENLKKTKAALARHGIRKTSELSDMKHFVLAQFKYNNSSRSFIRDRVTHLRHFASNGTLARAMYDAERMGLKHGSEKVRWCTSGAVQRTEHAIQFVDRYMGRAGGLAGPKDGDRVYAQHLLRGAADSLVRAMIAMPATQEGAKLTLEMQGLYAAVVDLNQSLTKRHERHDLNNDQQILPPWVLNKRVALDWDGVLDDKMMLPRSIKDPNNSRHRRLIDPAERQRGGQVHKILWGKPGSGDTTAAKDFRRAARRQNKSLTGLKDAYNQYLDDDMAPEKGTPQSNPKLGALRGKLNTALDANAIMLTQLEKASSRHSHAVLQRRYEGVLVDEANSANWFKKLLRSCCPSLCGTGIPDDTDLPNAHKQDIRYSRNLINRMRITARRQRAALLEMSRRTEETYLQRRAVAKGMLDNTRDLDVRAVGGNVDYHGQELYQDFLDSGWNRDVEGHEDAGRRSLDSQVDLAAPRPVRWQHQPQPLHYDVPQNDPHIMGIEANEYADQLSPLQAEMKYRKDERYQQNRPAFDRYGNDPSQFDFSDADSNLQRSRTHTQASIFDDQTHQASIRRDTISSIDADKYANQPPQPPSARSLNPQLHHAVSSATYDDSIYYNLEDYQNPARKADQNPENPPPHHLRHNVSSMTVGSIFDKPDQYLDPAHKKSNVEDDYNAVFHKEGEETGMTGDIVAPHFLDAHGQIANDEFEVRNEDEIVTDPGPPANPTGISIPPNLPQTDDDDDDDDDIVIVNQETLDGHQRVVPKGPAKSDASGTPIPEFPEVYRFDNADDKKSGAKNVSFDNSQNVQNYDADRQSSGIGSPMGTPKHRKKVSFSHNVNVKHYSKSSSEDDDDMQSLHLQDKDVDPVPQHQVDDNADDHRERYESESLSLDGDASSDDSALVDDPETFLDDIVDSGDEHGNDADDERPVIESTIGTYADGSTKPKT